MNSLKQANVIIIRFLLFFIFFSGVSGFLLTDSGFDVYSNNFSQESLNNSKLNFNSASFSARPPWDRWSIFQSSPRPSYFQQKGYEAGIIVGTSHALTNISTGDPLFLGTHWNTSDLNAGVFGRYRFNDRLALHSSFHYVRIHAADSLAPESSARYNRDFYFENQIFEFSVMGEVYIHEWTNHTPWDIFGYLGAAVFYHDPDLTIPPDSNQPEEDFSLIQPAIPMGMGINYFTDRNIKIGLDVGHRVTFTDHLDGFSRPASDANDAYFLFSFRISYFFDARKRFTPY